MRIKLRRVTYAVAAACLGAAGFTAATIAPASAATCSGYGCDHQNPYGAGCFNGSSVVQSATIGPTGASVYLHYSPACRTVWASIVNSPPAEPGDSAGGSAYINRNSDGASGFCNAGSASSCYTNMLYDGGVTSYASAQVDTGFAIYSARTASY